jgi:hypothetical protein
MDNKTRFSHMASAAISIGWVLKLNAEAIKDGQHQVPHPPMVGISCSSSNPQLLHDEHATKKYIIKVVFDEEDMYYLMSHTRLTICEINGFNWRHWYIKPRKTLWWDQFFGHVMGDDPERFKEIFWMSAATFHYITKLVCMDLERNPPLGLQNVPNRKLEVIRRVALAIRRLATGDSLRKIGEMFGVVDNTASKVVSNFINSIILHNCHHLTWLNFEGLQRVKPKFEAKHGILQVCGAIDCTHV